MSVKRAVLLLMLGGAVVPAIGQQIELPATAPATAARPGTTPRPQVDESALRYFAAQGDTRRLEAETARLRALYPDWNPPADLFGPVAQSDPELEKMWRLYADGKYADVRSAIAARQAADPQWVVPTDLVARLDEAEARRRLINASDASQWASVLRIATDTPALLTCTNVDVLWRVAEAFAKTSQPDRARDAYGYVLANCTDSGERLATVQKAMQTLDDKRLAELMQQEKRDPSGRGEFVALRDDLLRRRLGLAAQDPTLTVSPDDIAAVEKLARDGTQAGDALLLGWYLYRHGEPARALDWFKIALDRNGGAKAAEGYVLTLMAGKQALEAEPIAWKWRDSSPENAKAYLDVVVSLLTADPPPRLAPEVLARFSPVVTKEKYATGAQALGWYAYNTGQLKTAASWFATALEWAPEEEPAAYGLAVTRLRLRDRAGLNAIVAAWKDRSERIYALVSPEARRRLEQQAGAGQPATTSLSPVAAQPAPLAPREPLPLDAAPYEPAPARLSRATRVADGIDDGWNGGSGSGGGSRGAAAAALQSKRFGRCVSLSDEGFRRGTLSGGEAVARGWCLMELERPLEAAAAFDLALKNGSGQTLEDAAYGKSLAYLRKGMTNAAAVAATQAPNDSRRLVQLSADIITQRATAAYDDGRWVEAIIALDERNRLMPEDQGLMLLRGWAYFQLNDYNSADRIFKSLAAAGNPEGMKGVTAILEKRKLIRY
ncbi:hypothetical protein [Ancylobacter terrae]|uniref:hypothetical protein n=1 Tax=Ancylobacter sp. sgz301288 TaxID=3342077 RepID=UPI00385BE871